MGFVWPGIFFIMLPVAAKYNSLWRNPVKCIMNGLCAKNWMYPQIGCFISLYTSCSSFTLNTISLEMTSAFLLPDATLWSFGRVLRLSIFPACLDISMRPVGCHCSWKLRCKTPRCRCLISCINTAISAHPQVNFRCISRVFVDMEDISATTQKCTLCHYSTEGYITFLAIALLHSI